MGNGFTIAHRQLSRHILHILHTDLVTHVLFLQSKMVYEAEVLQESQVGGSDTQAKTKQQHVFRFARSGCNRPKMHQEI